MNGKRVGLLGVGGGRVEVVVRRGGAKGRAKTNGALSRKTSLRLKSPKK